MNLNQSIERQFGAAAAAYVASAVHRGGSDLDALVGAAELRGQERVLDVGAGPGATAFAFAPRAAEVVALDLTPEMLEAGRRQAAASGATNVRFERGDAASLPFPAASFDVVATRHSAHHFAAPERFAAEAVRVLRPGGRLLLLDSVAPEDHAQDTFLNAFEVLRDPSHVRDHRVSQWCAIFEGAGLRAELLGEFRLAIDFADWVARMQTPAVAVAGIQRLFAAAPDEVREAFEIEPGGDGSFALRAALIRARLRQQP